MRDSKVKALDLVGKFLNEFLETSEENFSIEQENFNKKLTKATQENPWFTNEFLKLNLDYWAKQLQQLNLENWLNKYAPVGQKKTVGLILAGNIPMVGLHDVLCSVLSGHQTLIKLSSKDQILIPALLNLWETFATTSLDFTFVEKLENYDAVIATGSNNTSQYFEYYFREKPRLIRKNRSSVAVISGQESTKDLQNLAKDIFTYFGLGCRNVSHLLIPKEMKLDVIFENLLSYSHIINHHKYANNYDYNKAIFLLNQDLFWDNNFVIIKENPSLFSPLSVLHFTRYDSLNDVNEILKENEYNIQCCVSSPGLIENSVAFGETQNPSLESYADQIDTMQFLREI